MVYHIHHDLVAIPAAVYLQPVHTYTKRFETKYMQIQCNTNTYSQESILHYR